MYIEKSAYKSLEIDKITDLVSKRCRSEIGALVARNISPASDMDELEKRQTLYRDVEDYRGRRGELPWADGVVSVAFMLEFAEENGLLSGEDLVRIRLLLSLAGKIRETLAAARAEYPSFSILLGNMRDFSEETEALTVIDDEGRLYDYASEKLASLRLQMRELKDLLRRRGHALLNDPAIASMLQERVLTLRNGRHAFLVRQDALSQFPGAVVDRSGSGNSVYMEPHALIQLNNEYSKLRGEEMLEETRLLREFTAKLIKRKNGIIETENVLGTLDMFYAFSETSRLDKWRMPSLSKRPEFNFSYARHPLLGGKAVPIDIRCGGKFSILVITGPNTGGKTVALKTAGICVYFGWLGLPIPAAESSVLGDIGEMFADIGDEQSIEQNLSTFSAHVTHISAILDKVTPRSVVMLDELGAGTDPEEGAALGIALLDWLRERKAMVLATTHHNPIKRYALAEEGVETASVEFDASTLSPTYRILIGIPGRSNALLIAGKLGLKRSVIKRAEAAINGREISMEDLIGELHEKRAALEKESREVEASRRKLESLEKDYKEKIKAIEEKRDALIANADKKALSIVRNAEDSARALIKNLERAEAESQARRELEKKRSHFHKIEKTAIKREEKKEAAESVAASGQELKAGDIVQVIGTSKSASVVEVRGKKALIRAGAAELEVPMTKLRIITGRTAPSQPSVQIKVSRPVGVPSSIMVRGMTIDEAMPMVEQYLDQAYCAGYDVVTVIHGRGQGILRREVQDLCKRLPYIAEHNLGGPGEGGYGVTVVKFKR